MRPGPHDHHAEQHRCALPGAEAVTLRSGRHFPRHAHDQFGIGVVTSGGHRSWSGVGHVEAAAGDTIMVNPGEMHDGTPLGAAPRGWRMVYLDPALVQETLDGGGAALPVLRPVARDPLLARGAGRLFAAATRPDADPLAREEALLRCLALACRRHALATPPSRAGLAPGVARALERLDAAPELPATLSELAGLAGTGRFQLLRGFARAVGTTPHAYLVQRRVLLARRLLAGGVAPAEAAAAAGFADQSHLTRAFVRHLGVTPARYRAAVA